MAGKADWLAHGLPREGDTAGVPYAGELADPEPPTCRLDTPVGEVAELLDGSRYGFCVVVSRRRVVLGRVRRGALAGADPAARAETVMEPGPKTFRANTKVDELVERLTEDQLKTAIITTPEGVLLGVFHR